MTYGRLAQLVEHLLDVQEVTGSSPVPSTTSPQTKKVWGLFFVVAVQDSNSTCRAQRRQSKPQCNDDDRSQRLKQGGVVGAAF